MRFKLKGYEKIAAISERMGVSFNQAVNIAVDGLDDAAIEMIHAHGHEQGLRLGIERAQAGERAAGYAQAKQTFCLSFPCPFCGQPVEIRAGDVFARLALMTVVASGLGHQDGCPEQPNERARAAILTSDNGRVSDVRTPRTPPRVAESNPYSLPQI